MSIASRIKEMINHTSNTYNKLENLGEDFSTTNKNIENISSTLQNIYDDWPKVIVDDVTTANINKTKSGRAQIDLKGNTEQFTTTGIQLFNKNTITPNTRLSTEGTPFSENGFFLTDYIPVKANTTYTGSTAFTNLYNRIAYYDSNKTYLNKNDGGDSYKFTTPANTAFVRFGKQTVQLDTYMLVEGDYNTSDFPSYEPYTGGTASPNPDYPQDVEVVSGENVVKVVNKNLFDTELEQNARSNADGTTKIWSSNYVRTINKIKVKPNTTYRISFTLENSNGGDIQQYQKDGIYIGNIELGQNGISFTTPENCYYINVQWYRSIGITPSDVSNIQLELGSTATTYTEHKEQDFPISLHSRNLLDFSIINQVPSVSNGQLATYNGAASSDFIEIDKSKNYIVSFEYTGTHINNTFYIFYYDENKNFLGCAVNVRSEYLLNSSNYYSSSKYVKARTDRLFPLIWSQLEEGSTATEYQPYYHYELCKIGDYQDYIYSIRGKNLFSLTNNYSRNGIDYTFNNSTLMINGTSTGEGGFTTIADTPKIATLSAGTYTLSFNFVSGTISGTSNVVIRNLDTSTNIVDSVYGANTTYTFTLSAETNIGFNLYQLGSGRQYNNYVVNIQLERGSVATTYEPYGSNNTYWYIKKNISKVVLNGSETIYSDWQDGSTPDYIQFYLKADFLDNNYKESRNQAAYSNYFRCLSLTIWRF